MLCVTLLSVNQKKKRRGGEKDEAQLDLMSLFRLIRVHPLPRSVASLGHLNKSRKQSVDV